jgi:hypothetical protein
MTDTPITDVNGDTVTTGVFLPAGQSRPADIGQMIGIGIIGDDNETSIVLVLAPADGIALAHKLTETAEAVISGDYEITDRWD